VGLLTWLFYSCYLFVPFMFTPGAVVLLSSVAPRTAAAAGLASRYLYWCGRSGRRYLFTSTDHASLADFGDGVAIAAVHGRLVWAGEAADLTRLPRAAGLSRPALYVHLLAATPEERRVVIEDLRPVEARHMRLAA
jgi:hypothetical protein